MSPDARSDDRAPTPAHYDRRGFLRRGVRAGGALLGSAAGLDALSAQASPTGGAPVPAAPSVAGPPPNILVIVVDQMRYPRWFGGGGPAVTFSPNIGRLRRGGVSFARHQTASNDCSPARSTLLTGLHTHQTGCMITGVSTLAPAFDTWGSYLRELGYTTYWYGKWHLTRDDRHWNEIDGPPSLERYGFDGGTFPSPNGAPVQGWHADPKITGQFVDWYQQAGGDTPWCTTVSFVNPHDIAWWYRWSDISAAESSAPPLIHRLPANFETPQQLHSKPLVQRSLQNTTDLSFGDVPYGGPELLPSWMPFLDLYVKLQLAVDRQIGIVLDALASRPDVAANTVVVFTADHGEYGGSHGLRGKGAGLYREGINVPLIVNDLRRTATAFPAITRTQLSSSVDIVPLLLTLASGSDQWRDEPRYSHLATRLDLAAILRDPTAPGRAYALHATDELVTEFALEPYSMIAPIHIVGLVTERAKYGVYSHWRRATVEPVAAAQERELYDYSTRAGQLEIDNRAGASRLEDSLAATLDSAISEELRAPLPIRLHGAQRTGFADYFKSEQRATEVSLARRRQELEQIAVSQLGSTPGGRRRHRPPKPT
ncbi:MAG TPA: sulfatase-like hydrolase/transferase [Solirubrobacteraceae bacterium]|nr:sulfatase-like hydrolase/transferase [Solirubrobacteraceae bacterium]